MVKVHYSLLIEGATLKIKQKVKLKDANQQWDVTMAELFVKKQSAVVPIIITQVKNYRFGQDKLIVF